MTVIDWHLMDYGNGLAAQKQLLARRIRGDCADTLVMAEHAPVFTVGRQGRAEDCVVSTDERARRIPVVRVERGGDVTYHGPGQLVAYPIVRLPLGRRDIHAFIRALEQALISVCRHFGVSAVSIEGLTGVWVPRDTDGEAHRAIWQGEKKIASIGLAFKQWTCYHGLALNVCNDLAPFTYIHLCGLPGKEATSLAQETGRAISTDEVKPVLADALETHWRKFCHG